MMKRVLPRGGWHRAVVMVLILPLHGVRRARRVTRVVREEEGAGVLTRSVAGEAVRGDLGLDDVCAVLDESHLVHARLLHRGRERLARLDQVRALRGQLGLGGLLSAPQKQKKQKKNAQTSEFLEDEKKSTRFSFWEKKEKRACRGEKRASPSARARRASSATASSAHWRSATAREALCSWKCISSRRCCSSATRASRLRRCIHQGSSLCPILHQKSPSEVARARARAPRARAGRGRRRARARPRRTAARPVARRTTSRNFALQKKRVVVMKRLHTGVSLSLSLVTRSKNLSLSLSLAPSENAQNAVFGLSRDFSRERAFSHVGWCPNFGPVVCPKPPPRLSTFDVRERRTDAVCFWDLDFGVEMLRLFFELPLQLPQGALLGVQPTRQL